MKNGLTYLATAVALCSLLLSSGYTPLTAGEGLILTVNSASASISWTSEAPSANKRVVKRDIAAMRRRIADDSAGTYISEILASNDSALSRWPDRSDRAVRVWIGEGDDLTGVTDTLKQQVQEAFFEWQRTGIPVQFGFVRDSADAEVHVDWVDHFDEPISGSTLWARDQNWWIASGRITIALQNSIGQRLSPVAVRAIALHEVGHLLGLDHTVDTLSILAPRVRVKTLSDADRATMSLLYSLPAGALR